MRAPSLEDQSLLYEFLSSDSNLYNKLSPASPNILRSASEFLMGLTFCARDDPLSFENISSDLICFLDPSEFGLSSRISNQRAKLTALRRLFDNWPGAEILDDAEGPQDNIVSRSDYIVEANIVLSFLRAYGALRAGTTADSGFCGTKTMKLHSD